MCRLTMPWCLSNPQKKLSIFCIDTRKDDRTALSNKVLYCKYKSLFKLVLKKEKSKNNQEFAKTSVEKIQISNSCERKANN